MTKTPQASLKVTFVVAMAAVLGAACSDTTTTQSPLAVPAPSAEARIPQLGTCDSLAAPAGTKLSRRLFAQGVQIYRWNGASWAFVAPQAQLTADAAGTAVVGVHYAGPTWESNSGSKVIGAVAKRCPSPNGAIPWLLLSAVSDSAPGIFKGTKFIQRVNTVGGQAPAAPGSTVGQESNVPYTAEYFFYRAQ
jgi:hypothetical protein